MKKKQKVAVKNAKESGAVRNRSAEIPALNINALLNDGEIPLLARR